MMSSQCLRIIFLVIYFIWSVEPSPPSTLRHVNMLYRHGDRSPAMIYPKDINKEDSWPDGLGWLTNIGKQQQYELGQYLRERYGGFINVTRFDHRQIAIQASAVERCLMSVYSNLAGFFPPQDDQIWNEKLLWQPIPVKSVPVFQDNKLAIQASCPRYDQLLADAYASPKAMDFQKQNKAFLKMVSQNSGWNESLSNLWQVFDALECEQAHNMTWNDWVYKTGVWKKLKEVTVFGWDFLFSTTEMAKLKGGPLLKEIVENMKASVNGSSGDLKLHMYSAHDTTVASLLNAMTVFNFMRPPYRTLILVELHRIDDEDVVKIFLRNDTTKDPFYLLPKGCEDPCKLATFQSVVAARIPHDWQQECQVQSSSVHSLSPAYFIQDTMMTVLLATDIRSDVSMSQHLKEIEDRLKEFSSVISGVTPQGPQDEVIDQMKHLENEIEKSLGTDVNAPCNNQRELEGEKEALSLQISLHKKNINLLEDELHHLLKEKSQMAEVPDSDIKALKLKQLEADDLMFRKHLGMEIRKVKGNCLQIAFSKIDQKQPNSLFLFSLKFDENRQYIVSDCKPQIPALNEILLKLNTDSDFEKFIHTMRQSFKKYVA